MNLGSKILEIRKKNKMSQEEFAEIFNVTRQTISSWENSKSYPDIETLVKISNRFDISLDILLKEDKVMIKKIDKGIKNYRKLKIILVSICTLLLICGIVYGVNYISFSRKYDAVKDEIETKYYKALEENKFEKKDRLYILKISDTVKFVTGTQEMPMKKDRVLHFYAKYLYAYIDNEGNMIEIRFDDFNDFYLEQKLKNKEEKIIFTTNKLKEKERTNIDIISNKTNYNKEELEKIVKQGYKLYDEMYSCNLCK